MQRSIRHQLGKLPYREMRQLSFDIFEALDGHDKVDQTTVADVLADLPMDDPGDEMEAERRKLLAEFFSRKKQITIQPQGSGYSFQIPSIGMEHRSDNIEEGLYELIQMLISYAVLD